MDTEKLKILIIEDEEPIRKGLSDTFVFNGYEVLSAERGDTGLQLALSEKIDLVLLDIMLPGIDGFQICDEIRKKRPHLPIVMLTAKSSEEDIITGLQLGADDYIGKPFSIQELLLRAQAILKRTRKDIFDRDLLKLGDEIEIDCKNLAGRTRKDQDIDFTKREIEILLYLFHNAHRPVSRDELLSEVWNYSREAAIETRTVDIHIAKLRRKIERDPKKPTFLITVRGEGYKLLGAKL